MKRAQDQTQILQINLIKKELKTINQKITKLMHSNEKLIKNVNDLEKLSAKIKAKKRVSYIDWLENERRMKNNF